jgi:hypothetical protein
MGAIRRGKERRREKETSPIPYYYFHYCFECGRFHGKWFDDEGYHRNYCLKWCKRVRPDKMAWWCFTFRIAIKKGERHVSKEKRNNSDLAHQWMGQEPKTSAKPRFVWKKGRCPNCPLEHADFWDEAYAKNQTKKFCSERCKWEFKRFKKKCEKSGRVYRDHT